VGDALTAPARILVLGHTGQVASALRYGDWPSDIVVETRGRASLDLLRPQSVLPVINSGNWAAVVNAAAYTQVDEAEKDSRSAYLVNRDAPAEVARACAQLDIPLVHLSTDYVFDGTRASPYDEGARVQPLSVYGASKAAGEQAVRAQLSRYVILRTSWVFGPVGHNFVIAMLALARERDDVFVVNDQYGRPTAAQDIADAIIGIVRALLHGKTCGYGTFHFANRGTTNWYEFAREVFRQAERRGVSRTPQVTPIPAAARSAQAERPMNSELDTTKIEQVYGVLPRHWQASLAQTLDRVIGPVGSTREGEGVK